MPAEIPDGAVIVARAILNSSLWSMRPEDCKVAITCIALANHEPRDWWNGKRLIRIERGQFARSWDGLAKAAVLSIKVVRTSVQNLENTGFLARSRAGRYSLFTIPKYEHYQDLTKYYSTKKLETGKKSGSDRAGRGQDAGSDRATNNNKGNNLKKGGGEEPPAAPPPGTPDPDEFALTLGAFSSWELPGEEAKKKAIRDLLRQGVSHHRIRETAKQNGTSDFYAVFDRLKNGKAESAFIPTPPEPKRPTVNPKEHEEKKAQLAEIDAKIKALPESQVDQWTREAMERAGAQKIYGPAIKLFVVAELRRRMADLCGVKGV